MYKLIRDEKIEDAAILCTKHCKSIKEFNNVDEMFEYAVSTYADGLIIKKKGNRNYSEQIYFHKYNGFKLNEKSLVIYLKTMQPNGKWDVQRIRF